MVNFFLPCLDPHPKPQTTAEKLAYQVGTKASHTQTMLRWEKSKFCTRHYYKVLDKTAGRIKVSFGWLPFPLVFESRISHSSQPRPSPRTKMQIQTKFPRGL
ncbi:UNVERIFIED_CONTAM: hypothetical protein K2H54_047933 [Gekko kuhli]